MWSLETNLSPSKWRLRWTDLYLVEAVIYRILLPFSSWTRADLELENLNQDHEVREYLFCPICFKYVELWLHYDMHSVATLREIKGLLCLNGFICRRLYVSLRYVTSWNNWFNLFVSYMQVYVDCVVFNLDSIFLVPFSLLTWKIFVYKDCFFAFFSILCFTSQ